MKCRPLNLLTAASLLPCVAAVALWVRSYRSLWHVRYERSGRTPEGWRRVGYHLQLVWGRWTVARTEFHARSAEEVAAAESLTPAGSRFQRVRGTSLGIGSAKQKHPLNAIGIRPYRRVRDGSSSRYEERSVAVPAWIVAAAAALLSMALLFRVVSR